MSNSNPFDDLAEDVEESDENESNDEVLELESETTSDEEFNERPTTSSTTFRDTERSSAGNDHGLGSSQSESIDGPTLGNSSPPFPYSDAEQRQMYVQSGLWDDFEDLKFDAELELRRTFEVRNVEQREIDTAVTRLVLEHFTPKEIAEMVIQMRGFDPLNPD